jgi:hypothetical protein
MAGPWEAYQSNGAPEGPWSAYQRAEENEQEAADHGLSKRQKLSAVEKAINPITSYPETYQRMNKEARDQISRGADQLSSGLFGHGVVGDLPEFVSGLGNMALGGLGYVASPVNAAYRSIVGQPIEDVTGIPREYTEFAAQLATPGLGLPGAVKGPTPNLPRPAAAPVAPESNGIVAAAERVSQVAPEPINVPRAFASDSMPVQRTAQSVRNLPIVGDAIPRATGEMADQLAGARNAIASSYGEGSGPNVASRISRTLDDAATQEATAAREAVAQGDAAVLADWERAHTAAREGIAARENNALQAARRSIGDMSPQDMGQTLIARLRQGEGEARAAKERLYGIAGDSDAAIEASAVQNIRRDVSRALDEQGLFVDEQLTPAAARMVRELDNVPVQNVVGQKPAGISKPAAPVQSSPAPRGPEPQSLLEFLASKGGLGPDAELEAIGAQSHVVNVGGAGRRKLTRQGGLPLDYAREAAEEAGYLRGDHKGTSTVRDLLDAIDAEMRGNRRYAQGREGTVDKRTAAARSEREQHEWDQFRRSREDEIAGSDFPGDRASAGRPVSVQGLEQTRKRLNAIRQAASNDADRRAAGQVMRAYDDWLDNAFDMSLFSGSDEALDAYRKARAANADWRTRFGYNGRDDADRLINRVITGEVTPQEFSNWLVGSTQVGSKGVSSRLLTRVAEATGGDAEAMQAIRGGVWNRLTQTAEGVADKSAGKIADDVSQFLNGSGRDVADRLFSPQQRLIAEAYVDTLRRGADARTTLAEAAANSKPSAAKVNIGPMQELAETVLGKGGKTDEALFNAIDAYAKAGGRGDVKTLSDLVKAIPQKDRGDLAGALIRKMGHSAQTNDFTLEMFASDWGKYSPQAKAVLFGNAGPYRQALDDIAMISQRYKDIGRRFGNPSGTAQNVSLLGTAAWVTGSPFTAIPAILGGTVAAKMLAAPAGASSISKWGKVMESAKQSPSPQRIAALQVASRNLVNTSVAFGGKMSPPEFMRQLQGAVPAGAQDEQR